VEHPGRFNRESRCHEHAADDCKNVSHYVNSL
jgi:hypothetical protein